MTQGWSALLRVVAVALVVAAGVLVAATLTSDFFGVLALVPLALVLAAAACWRVAFAIRRQVGDSAAWAEVAALRGWLDQRETLLASLPVPAAAWDANGQLLFATAS